MSAGKVFFNKWIGWIFLSLFSVNLTDGRTTPIISSLAKKTIFSNSGKTTPGPEKSYTGIKIMHDSVFYLYYHEQTLAVVEVGSKGALFNCELLEARTEEDQLAALNSLTPLMATVKKISFSHMIDLMSLCQKIDLPSNLGGDFVNKKPLSNLNPKQFTSLLSGVFPGTKWCGSGDIAASYFDLGQDQQLDKCCRTHDLCPVKIPGKKTQYNLTNRAVYTASHCTCDEHFYKCLKSLGSPVSNFVGAIYFNVNPGQCIEDVPKDSVGSETEKRITNKNFKF